MFKLYSGIHVIHIGLQGCLFSVVSLWDYCCFCCFSVFEGMPIPYPKREFLSEEENDDKADTGASKVGEVVEKHSNLLEDLLKEQISSLWTEWVAINEKIPLVYNNSLCFANRACELCSTARHWLSLRNNPYLLLPSWDHHTIHSRCGLS